MWKWIRVAALLLVFASVSSNEWLTRRRLWTWEQPAVVAIYPLAGDASASTAAYISRLGAADFADIERFFAAEARRYSVPAVQPVLIQVYPGASALPPSPPQASSGLAVVWWSLKLRLYAWRMSHAGDGAIRVFVIFHDDRRLPLLPHSLGLQRGRIGVVHAFATPRMAGSNDVVIAHEILHAVGATDRYDLATNLPLVPDGLGDPDRRPLFPQDTAELMAGRRMTAPDAAEIPVALAQCVIGNTTAWEIHWLR